jgi:hypothetical protein
MSKSLRWRRRCLKACDNFRLWGTNFVEMENQRIQAKVSVAGFVHTYTDMAMVIMKQLEIEPLTMVQHKEKAQQATAAEIGAAVAQAIKQPQENAVTLESLKAAIAADPDGFKALFADVKNKGGRPKEGPGEVSSARACRSIRSNESSSGKHFVRLLLETRLAPKPQPI